MAAVILMIFYSRRLIILSNITIPLAVILIICHVRQLTILSNMTNPFADLSHPLLTLTILTADNLDLDLDLDLDVAIRDA